MLDMGNVSVTVQPVDLASVKAGADGTARPTGRRRGSARTGVRPGKTLD